MLPQKFDGDLTPQRSPRRRRLPPAPVPVYTLTETQEPADSAALGEFARLIRRRRLAIAAAAALGMIGGLLVALAQTPMYQARTSLQLEGFNDNHFLRDVSPISPLLSNASAESYLQNQVKLLESDTLARRVADAVGLKPDAGAQNRSVSTRRGADEWKVRAVREALKVRTSLQSQVIELLSYAKDPVMAADLANAAAAQFIGLNREARRQLVEEATAWLTNQTADLKNRLEAADRQLQDYARSSGLVFAGSEHTLMEDRMRQIQEGLAAAETDGAMKQARYAAAAEHHSELPDTMATGPLRQYQLELQALRKQAADLKVVFTPAHYKVKQVEAQMAELENAIRKERRETIDRLRTDYEAAARRERLMKAAYARQMSEVQRQTEKTTHYNVLKREVDTTQRLYDSMLQKLKEAGAASALRATNARIIDPATPPSRPFSPNLPLNLAIGLAAGLLGGLGLVLVQERSDKVRRPGDATVELPELGVIPSARSDRAFPVRGLLRRPKPGDLALVTWKQDSSLLSESFRAARASILFSSDLNRPRSLRFRGRILVVTSNEPMEGKTTVVTNLGVTLAETHRRVLLIDADLRRPKLHDVFDLCNDWGLSDLLSRPDALDSTPVESLARPTAVPNLFVLPSGPGAAGISSLLHSSNLSRLLRHLRTEFDLILIDTAPLTLYSDSRVLGRQSDGVVLVVRANRTSRDDLRNAHQRLVQDGIPVLGTILNDWRIDKTGSRAYGKYYKWYGRSEATT